MITYKKITDIKKELKNFYKEIICLDETSNIFTIFKLNY